MDQDIRRTIDELIARYTLEPELRDIYVEGPGDKALLEWFFKEFGCERVTIFEINCVDIGDNLIEEFGLQSRNRDRVIALALEFDRLLKGDVQCLICIADNDFDFLLGRKYDSRYLLYTDYTGMELYFFSESVLDHLLTACVRRVPCNTAALLACFADVLQEAFVIRAANEKLGWGLSWVDFRRCCKIENNLVTFDSENLITRYLLSGGRVGNMEEFTQVCEQLRSVELQTPKHRMRGHDYLELLAWYISKQAGRGGNKYNDRRVIRTMVLLAGDAKSLAAEKLYTELLKIYA